jgi:preprotein translocase subunit SecY
LGILDKFTGGALGRMTIFALGVMPYISASIIIQLLTTVLPQLEAIKKEGDSGRKKLNQYTRYLTVALSLFQSWGMITGLKAMPNSPVIDPGFLFNISGIVSLTGGTLFLMWLGEQITARGIGNGVSMIIFSGIVAGLPKAIASTLELGRTGALSSPFIAAVLLIILLAITFIVFFERAQRRVLIQYPKRQVSMNRQVGGESSHLPLKLNSAGVIPPIFASSLLVVPITIANFMGNSSTDGILGTLLLYMGPGKPLYIALYVLLILFFAFFYTSVVFNPTETAENLKKGGAIVPGYRPGVHTAEFLDYVLTRLTVVGAAYLALICVLPEILITKYSIPFYLNGTSLLIVVSVGIDTITQVQTHLIAHQYEGLIRKANLKKDKKR